MTLYQKPPLFKNKRKQQAKAVAGNLLGCGPAAPPASGWLATFINPEARKAIEQPPHCYARPARRAGPHRVRRRIAR